MTHGQTWFVIIFLCLLAVGWSCTLDQVINPKTPEQQRVDLYVYCVQSATNRQNYSDIGNCPKP